jgi:Tfp pilus assembly protein PilF
LADRAVQVLQAAIEQDPEVASLSERFYRPSERQELASHRINLALALGQRDETEAASEQLEVAFQIDDSSPFARAIAGDWAAQRDQASAAISHFERALQLRPDWPEVQAQLKSLQSGVETAP